MRTCRTAAVTPHQTVDLATLNALELLDDQAVMPSELEMSMHQVAKDARSSRAKPIAAWVAVRSGVYRSWLESTLVIPLPLFLCISCMVPCK
jgi:hypothetical protein